MKRTRVSGFGVVGRLRPFLFVLVAATLSACAATGGGVRDGGESAEAGIVRRDPPRAFQKEKAIAPEKTKETQVPRERPRIEVERERVR